MRSSEKAKFLVSQFTFQKDKSDFGTLHLDPDTTLCAGLWKRVVEPGTQTKSRPGCEVLPPWVSAPQMLMETKEGGKSLTQGSEEVIERWHVRAPSCLEWSWAQTVTWGRVSAAGAGTGGNLGTLGISRAAWGPW